MKKRIIRLISAAVMIVLIASVLAGCGSAEKKEAVKKFEEESEKFAFQAEKLYAELETAEYELDEDKPAMDADIEILLREKVDEAKKLDLTVPDIPDTTDEINAEIERMQNMELDRILSEIGSLRKELEKSRREYATQ